MAAFMTVGLLVYVLFTFYVSLSYQVVVFFQAEDYVDYGKYHEIKMRPEARNSKTLFIPAGRDMVIRFCLPKNSNVAIQNVRTMTDAPIKIRIDSHAIDTSTCDDEVTCIHTNSHVSLLAGQHFIRIQNSEASKYSHLDMEIDYVEMLIDDDIELDVLKCLVFCFEELGRKNFDHKDGQSLTKALIQNLSYKTTCAEVDNIKIPIFHSDAKKVEIKATHPGYKTFLNLRDADWKDCKLGVRGLWKIQNANMKNVCTNGNKFTISKSRIKNQDAYVMKFRLEGINQDSVDSEIGTILSLELDNIQSTTEVTLSYYGRTGTWIFGGMQSYSSSTRSVNWNIPDFTFSDVIENQISLTFSPMSDDIIIRSLALEKRHIASDTRFRMHDMNGLVVEGVQMDFWWLEKQAMKIRIMETSKVFNSVHYIVIYTLQPWMENGYSQILVLYQDGNIRMLPVTQEGADWIPFGSSMLVGESDPNDIRPKAPISQIDIHADTVSMHVTYADGNTVRLNVITDFVSTKLIMSDIHFTRNLPLVTFRSMYIKDGNCDVDHVMVDNGTDVRVISHWNTLSGTSVIFYRKCVSKHNTQSPDLAVYFLE